MPWLIAETDSEPLLLFVVLGGGDVACDDGDGFVDTAATVAEGVEPEDCNGVAVSLSLLAVRLAPEFEPVCTSGASIMRLPSARRDLAAAASENAADEARAAADDDDDDGVAVAFEDPERERGIAASSSMSGCEGGGGSDSTSSGPRKSGGAAVELTAAADGCAEAGASRTCASVGGDAISEAGAAALASVDCSIACSITCACSMFIVLNCFTMSELQDL